MLVAIKIDSVFNIIGQGFSNYKTMGAMMVVIAWLLDFVVSSNPAHVRCTRYNIMR